MALHDRHPLAFGDRSRTRTLADDNQSLRRQPAQTCPSARQESPPLPGPAVDEIPFLIALDYFLSLFDKSAQLVVWAFGQACAWIAASILAALLRVAASPSRRLRYGPFDTIGSRAPWR
jgi:hypothetical protein